MGIRKFSVLVLILAVILAIFSYQVPTAKADLVFVEGHITSNTTWTASNTYRVVGNVVIDPGVTLLIEAGTQIQFTDGTSLIVTGSLNATGAELNPVVFTSSRIVGSTAYRGAWNTIMFNATSDEKLSLNHVKIEYAARGVTIKSWKPAVVKNSHILNCSESGIHVGGWSILISSNVTLEGNTIELNKKGITTDNEPFHSGVTIKKNIIQYNDAEGVLFFSGGSTTPATNAHLRNITFTENKVLFNGRQNQFGGSGIYISVGSKANASIYNLSFASNILNSNNGTGLYITCAPSSITSAVNAYMYNLDFFNNTAESNVGGGIYLRAYAYSNQQTANAYIHDVLFTENNSTRNYSGITLDCDGTSSTLHESNAHIYNVQFDSNTVTLNERDGISVESTARNCSVHNVHVASNVAALNGGIGIIIDAYVGYDQGYLYGVSVSGSTVKANCIGVLARAPKHYNPTQYDVSIVDNIISGNTDTGIDVWGWNEGGLVSNITGNSIAYNKFGVVYRKATNGNIAHYNDIYCNTYGMNVTSGATVNAENNYWGHWNGPYNPSVWPEGGGDPVNGNGVDLDFIPFLTTNQSSLNQRPNAVLTSDKTTASLNELVTFSATDSTDDGFIEYYFFDFGDGTNSSWTTAPIVTHQYSVEGTYNVTLTVMDNLGVISTITEQVKTQITVVPEFPATLLLPLFMMATMFAALLYKKKASNQQKH